MMAGVALASVFTVAGGVQAQQAGDDGLFGFFEALDGIDTTQKLDREYWCFERTPFLKELATQGYKETGETGVDGVFLGLYVLKNGGTNEWGVLGLPRDKSIVKGAKTLADPLCVVTEGVNYPEGVRADKWVGDRIKLKNTAPQP